MRGIFLEPFNASCPDPESQANSAFACSGGVYAAPIVGTPFNLVCGQLEAVLFCRCAVKIMVAPMVVACMVATDMEHCNEVWEFLCKSGRSLALRRARNSATGGREAIALRR